MPTLTVVAGVNGAGKSTLTRLGRETFQDTVVLDPDAIARALQATGESGGSALDAGRMVLDMAEKLLTANHSFLVETTLSGNTYLRMMVRAKLRAIASFCYMWGRTMARFISSAFGSGEKGRPQRGRGRPIAEISQEPRKFQKAFTLAGEAAVFNNSTLQGHIRLAVKDVGGVVIVGALPKWASFIATV